MLGYFGCLLLLLFGCVGVPVFLVEDVEEVPAAERFVYRIEDGETHWVSAPSVDDAVAIHAELMAISLADYYAEFRPTITKLHPDAVVKITDEDGKRTEKTAAGWASSVFGEFGSTSW